MSLNASDLERCFQYHLRSSTVVKLSSTGKLLTWSLSSEKDWQKWLDDEVPNIDDKNVDGGLILLLTSRCDRPKLTVGPAELLNEKEMNEKVSIADDSTLCNPSRSNTQRSEVVLQGKEGQNDSGSGASRSIRDLPFTRKIFETIIRRFHTHGTLTRTITRADVSAFSANNVCMQSAEGDSYRSYVYNARTSNEWEGDLAMTATYFPCRQLTFGILLGCTETIEDKVIKRLRLVGSDATHPLIPFGIMAEIERSRHIKLVEDSIDGLETNIDQLSERIETRGETSQEEVDRRSRDRKEAWLDAAHLRNVLINWQNQLKHMTRHARLLQSAPTINTPQTATTKENGHGLQDTQHNGNLECRTLEASSTRISDRLEAIVEEYDEKIRDSAMRLDGMAMATQWSYSDTNVEIALATTRDSKHMRSISLITMIFLPGTFLATIFSMTFFDWGDGTGKARVSGMIWIYFALAFGFTAVTLGIWYFWTSRRRRTENICHY
ncbi:hypothetical protein VD0002_g1964 [Verticillium dahliae]|nr:hypothetical protein EV126DRAFT_429001 [Verticillium dahliae]PNH27365.1 hypothetical protein BJF96_g9322 [Verticillium dahliae]PNH56341.1 hypothetical protein VD0003_g1404 [Verticillium dahliae]PNH67926.1 hypothetical protein VD0002_g1964 [Verticillium dahliae]